MAAWYVKQLDRATPPPSPQDYPVGNDDTVRMFFLAHVFNIAAASGNRDEPTRHHRYQAAVHL